MYKLQAKISKEEPKNTTRKRFRGGEEPSAAKENPIESVEPLPANEVMPTPEAPTVEKPLVEAPLVEAPLVEAPLVEAPLVEAPQSEEPLVEAPLVEAPLVEEPLIEAPEAEAEEPEAAEEEVVGEQEPEPVAAEPSITGEGESAEIEAFRNMMGNIESQQVYFYMNTNISTEENRDKSYKREGVLHFTDSVSVGASQTTVMSLGSVIGNRGIETTTYDKLRNVALQKVGILLGENRRCYNTKIDFERNGETVLVHIYGTVYSKKSEQPTI